MRPPLSATSSSSAPGPSLRDTSKRVHPRELPIAGFRHEQKENNQHGVEFEAPFSGDSEKPPPRFSIDISMELERQLETMELASPPHSPLAAVKLLDGVVDGPEGGDALDKELLDPEVLAHIVTQLRQSLSEITKERDELVKMLAHANAEEANVKDALQLMADKATQAEEELDEAKKKVKEDEDQIAMLRAKVEESRRGLMRLQTESRRQSMAPGVDITRAVSLSVANPTASKRASFTPLTGSRHGRRPSATDLTPISSDHTLIPNSNSSGEAGQSPPSTSLRFSGLFGRVSPGIPDVDDSSQTSHGHAEIETLKSEIKTMKSDLENTQHELSEAHEAKEASDMCVKALREFIADNNIGASDVGSPPPPPPPSTMAVTGAQEPVDEPKKAVSGWGFKLWGSGSNTSDAGSPPPPMLSAPPWTTVIPPTPDTSVPVSSIPVPAAAPTPLPAPAPLTRKLTGLFSSRSSYSSKRSTQANTQMEGTVGSGKPLVNRSNSTYSYSDVSSVVEPMSPVSDHVVGLGVIVKPIGEDKVDGGLSLLDSSVGLVGDEVETVRTISLHEVDLNR